MGIDLLILGAFSHTNIILTWFFRSIYIVIFYIFAIIPTHRFTSASCVILVWFMLCNLEASYSTFDLSNIRKAYMFASYLVQLLETIGPTTERLRSNGFDFSIWENPKNYHLDLWNFDKYRDLSCCLMETFSGFLSGHFVYQFPIFQLVYKLEE